MLVKLKDLITIKNGTDYKHLAKGDIPVIGTGGILSYVNKFLYDKEAILLPRKGSLNNIMFMDQPFWTVDTMFYAIPNYKSVNPIYLYYHLSLINFVRYDIGSTIPSMTASLYYSLTIDLPPLEVQNRIASLLSSIDSQINRNRTIVKRLQVLGMTIYSKNIIGSTFNKMSLKSSITTGKEDANHANSNGEYKFFTCADEPLLCDDFKFVGKSVLVAGNGNFNVKYYDGKFNAYQRTYIIKNDLIIGNLYYTLLFNAELFRKKSNGSIIKFITIEMLNNIDIPCFSEKINHVLNKTLFKINKINENSYQLKQLKNKLLPLLINQQLI